jgi:hypothetical protein
MGIAQTYTEEQDDGITTYTVVTDRGSVGVATYNNKTDSYSKIEEAKARATEEALRKDQ